jgi:hypothetical protein
VLYRLAQLPEDNGPHSLRICRVIEARVNPPLPYISGFLAHFSDEMGVFCYFLRLILSAKTSFCRLSLAIVSPFSFQIVILQRRYCNIATRLIFLCNLAHVQENSMICTSVVIIDDEEVDEIGRGQKKRGAGETSGMIMV